MVELGLIGWPLGHSLSAQYFDDKFHKEGIEGHYDLYPLSNLSSFPDFLKSHSYLNGFNITIPYKEKILPYLNTLSKEAHEIGAVNVVKIYKKDNTGDIILEGHNSDWLGFRMSLVPFLKKEMKSALILGTGGAAKAIDYALKSLGIKTKFVTRNISSSNLSIKNDILTYDDLSSDLIKNNLIIVNTSPLGMFPEVNNYPKLPYYALTHHHLCYDLIYNPLETLFLKKCKYYGATIKNGLEMLYLQADLAWEIWK